VRNSFYKAEKQQLVSQLGQHEYRGANDTSSSALVCKLQERLKSVESSLKAQAFEQKKREDAMDMIKRDSMRCKELEAGLENVCLSHLTIFL